MEVLNDPPQRAVRWGLHPVHDYLSIGMVARFAQVKLQGPRRERPQA